MSTGAIIGIVVAAVVVLGLLVLAAVVLRRRRSGLALRPLEPRAREQFSRRWARAQEQFVDRPDAALAEAERIVTDVMTERGYPAIADHDRREADLPRGDREHYRAAHSVLERVPNGASTEDMRAAMVRYRSLFQDLIGDDRAKASH
ncbi:MULTISPECIES: hypothetical protein [Actinokineospora]|uniref:Secreted protein n=1 Tax=Actinokineospora fastidiosa TaxID=1816 RepID=A0A918LAZ7_9PSEU|nr:MULTISPECIES: hypothetical protein [Actinokineospora]UVS79327.1 hypothetical protein Actkin_03074 [Actinokineospora sp. UTMC 2448]GGS27662.1 hypothetical protein GCM10010171_20540 [Actinokineospora fastidiosa]